MSLLGTSNLAGIQIEPFGIKRNPPVYMFYTDLDLDFEGAYHVMINSYVGVPGSFERVCCFPHFHISIS